LIRPGRIDQLIYVPRPSKSDAKEILENALRNVELSPDVNLLEICDICYEKVSVDNLSCAWFKNFAREAILNCVRENIHSKKVYQRHFLDFFEKVL
jgi:SpoVK/Ycf46/Vps4 family AAA+-type ATPase